MKAWPTVVPAAVRRHALQPGVILPATFLLGLVLRCFHLESQELQYDEAATAYFAGLPWLHLWGGPAVLEPNPPLFYSLARTVSLAGGSVEQIRYISLLAGVLCIPLAWLIARDLAHDLAPDRAGGFAAAGAALLVAASPQHIAISRYARAYALLILLLMGAFYCVLQVRVRLRSTSAPRQENRRGALRWWSGYAICAAAALYTHHTAIVILAALNLAVLFGSVRNGDAGRRFLFEWLTANLLVAGLYAPWLPMLLSQVHNQVHSPAAVSSAAMSSAMAVHVPLVQRLWTMIGNPAPFAGLPWIDVRVLPVVLLAAWRFRRSRDAAFLAAFILGGLALMLAASLFRPLIDSKTLAWAGLFAVVATAIGCNAAGRFRLPLLVLVVLIELRSIPVVLDPAPEGWRDIAAVLRDNARPQDTFYTNYAAAVLPLRHYGWSETGMTMKVFARSNEEPWFRGHPWPIIAPHAVASDALKELRGVKRVWVLDYGTTPPDGITNEIATASVRRLHRRTEKLDLSLFVSVPANGAHGP